MTGQVAGPGGPGSVLAVMAHPDDAELWAGGTLAIHARTAPIAIAVPRNTEARMAEAAAGARILGASLHILDPLDTQNPNGTAAALGALLADLRPEVVVTHPLADMHPRHRRIAGALLDAIPTAVISTGYPRRVYTCDTYNSLTLHGPMHASTIVDISTTFEAKMQALAAHGGTQPITEEFAPMAENLARLWGARIGAAHAEAFTAIPILGRLPGATHL